MFSPEHTADEDIAEGGQSLENEATLNSLFKAMDQPVIIRLGKASISIRPEKRRDGKGHPARFRQINGDFKSSRCNPKMPPVFQRKAHLRI